MSKETMSEEAKAAAAATAAAAAIAEETKYGVKSTVRRCTSGACEAFVICVSACIGCYVGGKICKAVDGWFKGRSTPVEDIAAAAETVAA